MPNGTRLVLMATEKCFEGSRRKNSFVGRFTEERSRPSGNIPCFSTQENSECNKATLIGDRQQSTEESIRQIKFQGAEEGEVKPQALKVIKIKNSFLYFL